MDMITICLISKDKVHGSIMVLRVELTSHFQLSTKST